MIEYALRLVPKVMVGLVGIWLLLFMLDKLNHEEPPQVEPYFQFDKNRPAYEISEYDYSNRRIIYREYGPAPEQRYQSSSTVEDIILDANIEVEDLLDYQLGR